jgi:hypothetical protein
LKPLLPLRTPKVIDFFHYYSIGIANGSGGDCFVWGDGDAGQLGLGHLDHHPNIAINNSFPAGLCD